MLSVLIVLVYISLLFFNNIIKDKLSRYLYTFIISWHFFIFLFSSFDPMGFYPVSLYAYSLSILSIVFFSIGFVSFRIKSSEIGKVLKNKTFNIFVLENKVYKIVLILFCVSMAYFVNKYILLLANYTAIESRLIRYNINFFGNSVWVNLFYNVILTSFFYISVFVICGCLFVKKNKLVFILTLLYVLMYSFVGSGREPIFFLFFNLLFYLFLFKSLKCESVFALKIIRFNFKSKFYILCMLILAMGFLLFLSGLRENVNVRSLETIYLVSESLLNNILSYLLGPIRAFDFIIHSDYYLDKLGYPWGGLAVFSGLNEYLYMFLQFLGIDAGVSSSRIIGHVQEIQLSVSPNVQYFNYTFTAFLTCYLDYGIISVVLYPFIGGILFRYVISELYRCATFPLLAMICYLFYMSIFSFATLVLVQTTPWFYLLLLFFLHKNKI